MEDNQASIFFFFLGKSFSRCPRWWMFNYVFMNEECAMQMRAIHKKIENMAAATSASRRHWHCSDPPSPSPAHRRRVLGGGRRRENAAWRFSSYFMLNRPRLGTFIKKFSQKRSDSRNALYLKECILGLAVTHLTLSNPQKINKIWITRKRKLISRMNLNPVSTENISADTSPSSC